MINAFKKRLFGRSRSSLNLFLVLPVLVLLSVGCLCPSDDEPETCLTSDGSSLIWAGSNLMKIGLADGSVTMLEPTRYSGVFCAEGSEIIALREDWVRKDNESRRARTARWRNSPKSYRLADIDSFQGYRGFIQNRFFVSGSRGFVERSRSSGKSSIRYRVYDQPQIFSLEDSETGELKSHYLYRERLGLPETTPYDDLWFYPAGVEENGTLQFAMHNKTDKAVNLYKLNLFDGKIARTGVSVPLPPNARYLEKVVSEKTGKFIAFVYNGEEDRKSRTLVNVVNAQTGQTVVSTSVGGISYMSDTPSLFFNEDGTRLAMIVEGLRYEPSESVLDITIFDLATGREISAFDAKSFFGNPVKIRLLRFIGDDLVLTYVPFQKPFRDKEKRLCRVSVPDQRTVWDVKLP